MTPLCACCGEPFNKLRFDLGFRTCLDCGETIARDVKHCIVPMHKSNYVVITDQSLLNGINNKGNKYG